MQVKSFPAAIEVKADATPDAPHGEFTALVSVFGNVDLGGDRVMPNAFAKSIAKIAEQGKTLPVVWSHDFGTAESFIGKALEVTEDPERGLIVRGAFFDTPRAQTVRTLLNERVVSEFSFAYNVVDERKADDGATELLELDLIEVGPTIRGMNPATQLLDAKGALTENLKTGRTLSTKNENKIRDAVALLDEVLATLDQDTTKSTTVEAQTEVEPAVEATEAQAEDAISGLHPEVAAALVDLETAEE